MMTTQAERLTMEANALCNRLAAQASIVRIRGDRKKAARIMRIRRRAVQRWSRRLDKWAVASCGPPVAVLPCRHCGERFGCDNETR